MERASGTPTTQQSFNTTGPFTREEAEGEVRKLAPGLQAHKGLRRGWGSPAVDPETPPSPLCMQIKAGQHPRAPRSWFPTHPQGWPQEGLAKGEARAHPAAADPPLAGWWFRKARDPSWACRLVASQGFLQEAPHAGLPRAGPLCTRAAAGRFPRRGYRRGPSRAAVGPRAQLRTCRVGRPPPSPVTPRPAAL